MLCIELIFVEFCEYWNLNIEVFVFMFVVYYFDLVCMFINFKLIKVLNKNYWWMGFDLKIDSSGLMLL